MIICIIGLFFISTASAFELNETEIINQEDNIEIIQNPIENDQLNQTGDTPIISKEYTPKNAAELQDSVDQSNSGDTIILDGYYLLNSTITVKKQLNFLGKNNAVIDGNHAIKLFSVSGCEITFKNITFKNAYSPNDRGAAISGQNDWFSVVNYVDNCTFIDNVAFYGAAISGICIATNCIFERNTARYGGAIYSCDAINCTFINNSADSGGAMYGRSALNCIFISNVASSNGGAVSGSAENCYFERNSAQNGGAILGDSVNCTFFKNSASNDGGAAYRSKVINSTFINNTAKRNGGAIANDLNQKSIVFNCKFENNTALNGGASYGCNISNCIFTLNHADSNGGAIYYSDAFNSTFEKNTAKNGGAIAGDNNEIVKCKLTNNSANNGGAACNVALFNCNLTGNNASENGGSMINGFANKCTFTNNHANGDGGAVYNGEVANSIFNSNTAENNGGAMNGKRALNCTFIQNSAGNYGGAVNDAEVSQNSRFQDNTANIGENVNDVTYFEIKKTLTDLKELLNNNLSEIYLEDNYTAEFSLDYYLKEGIPINRSVTIYGNGFTVDGNGFSKIFNVMNENVIFKNLFFVNVKDGAIVGKCVIENSTFIHNYGNVINGRVTVVNCRFINNSGRVIIGQYIWNNFDSIYQCQVFKCWFENNSGGAIQFGYAVNCTFINNSATDGGAIDTGVAVNCTFINNSATESGGAVHSVEAVNCLFINNHNYYSSYAYSDLGGGAMNRGSAKNCTFINNTASRYGGAINVNFNIENCTFINNSAQYGGAINCQNNVKDCIFINNSNQAIRFEKSATVSNCTFINNDVGVDKVTDVSSTVVNCTFYNNKKSGNAENAINCSFINNLDSFSGNAIKCRFINNSASNGGAMNGGTAINCTFINNSAEHSGGATYHVLKIVNCTFINNSASDGGAINGDLYRGPPYYTKYDAIVENCTFINNSAIHGGALSNVNSVIISLFINNSATYGGSLIGTYDLTYAVYEYTGWRYVVAGTYHTNVVNCTFINGSAKYGGAMYDGNAVNCSFVNNSADYGGTIFINSNMTVSYCNFTNCFANFKGGAIYINQSGNITYCNFINCASDDDNSMAVNLSANYSIMECIFDKYPTNINYHYVSSLISANLTYYNGEEGILIAELSDMRGVLKNQTVYILINDKKYNVTTDSNGSARFNIPFYLNRAGIYNATLIYEGDNVINPSSFNLTVTINKHIAVLNASDLVLFKNEYGTLIANLSNIRGSLVNKTITFTVNGRTRSLTTDENGLVDFNVINFVSDKGEYIVNIAFAGDEFNHPVSRNISFIYVDYKGILTGRVDGKYYNDTILTFNLINYRSNKPINGETIKLTFSNGENVYLKTDVDGNAVYRMPFVPDYYDVVACVEGEFISVNNVSFKEIEINKIFGVIEHNLLNGNKTIQFKLSHRFNQDSLRNIRLKLIFNNGEETEIISDDNGIASYDIPFPKGIYSVSVTVIGDYKDFEPNPEYIRDIVVSNDLNCSVNFTNNITFDFGEYGSTNYTVEGGYIDSNHISVVDHPEAIISVNNNTITVFGLAVGNYTLIVETIPDDYHNPVNATLNITVNTVKSKVTFSAGVSFEYGGSASIYVTVEGGTVNGKSIQILDHPEAKITFEKNMITVSGLNPGTYTLRVESIPDNDHKAGEGTVGITVRKATAVIKASKLTVALKSGALWTIKLIDSKTKKPISNMKVTLKVYTGKKYKTVTLNTNSKGEANYQTRSLTKGDHKVVVSSNHVGYNLNDFTSSIKVIKPKALKFKLKKNNPTKKATLISFQILDKKTKKGVNGIKVKVKIYTGKKYKSFTLKSKKVSKIKGIIGFTTNEFSAGKHKVVIEPVSLKYSGSGKTTMVIKKSARKYPKKTFKV